MRLLFHFSREHLREFLQHKVEFGTGSEIMTTHNRKLGQWGENCAEEFLIGQGFKILDKNARTSEGEIDLIARRADLVVFAEVKTRAHNRNGYPEDAVTDEKMEHMVASAEIYLDQHPDLVGQWRIDVIAITVTGRGKDPQIEWFEDAE